MPVSKELILSVAGRAILTVALILLVVLPCALVYWLMSAENEVVQTKQDQMTRIEEQLTRTNDLIETIFKIEIDEEFSTWSTPVTVSAYTAREEECDSSPETTADMTPSRIGLLAVSRDLIEVMGLKFGDVVMLVDRGASLGVFTISDVMNPRWTNRVDILHGNLAAARLFGVRENVLLVRVVGDSHE